MSDSNRLLYTAGAIGLVVFVIAANAIAFGYLFSPLRQHGEQQQTIAQQETGHAERSPSGAVPLGDLELVESPSREEKQRAEQRDSDDLRAQQIMAVAGLVSLALTSLGLVLIGRTLFYTRRAVDEAREATKAASRGARAALRANEVFKETAKRELRAYVIARIAGIDEVGPDKSPRVRVGIHNVGQTPAYKLNRNLQANYIGGDDQFSFPFLEIDQSDRDDYTIGPGESYSILSWKRPDWTLSAEQITAVGDKKAAIVIMGVITYEDVFGDSHTYRLCHVYTGGFEPNHGSYQKGQNYEE